MLLRIKTGFALAVVLLLLGCVFTPALRAGETPPAAPATADNPAPAKPPIDSAAIVADAEKEAAKKEAEKEAAAKAEKRAALKAQLDLSPLVVDGIVPYVETHEKGTLGNPQKLGKAGMGDRISVVINGLSEALKYELVDPTKLVLFIDGRIFNGVYPESVGYNSVVYKLERTKDAIDSWNGLLGSPRLDSIKPVVVSVGYADQKPFGVAKGYEKANLNLIVYRKKWAVGSLIVLILMVLVFWKYDGKDLLRDAGPPKPDPGKKRPYSLAKVQVAWWFFLVVGCFLLIYLITGEYTMTEQALILIGIGTGTALGSAMIDASKRDSVDSDLETLKPQQARLKAEVDQLKDDKEKLEAAITEHNDVITNAGAAAAAVDAAKASLKTDQESLNAKTIELAEKNSKKDLLDARIAESFQGLSKPVSDTLWCDLVTDANGPSFHRFQMIVWTVILGILFLAGVYKNLAMPEFSGTMLALMGISAGTYLGFKIPEKQNGADPTVPPAAGGGAAAGAGGAAAGGGGAAPGGGGAAAGGGGAAPGGGAAAAGGADQEEGEDPVPNDAVG